MSDDIRKKLDALKAEQQRLLDELEQQQQTEPAKLDEPDTGQPSADSELREPKAQSPRSLEVAQPSQPDVPTAVDDVPQEVPVPDKPFTLPIPESKPVKPLPPPDLDLSDAVLDIPEDVDERVEWTSHADDIEHSMQVSSKQQAAVLDQITDILDHSTVQFEHMISRLTRMP